ncbi:MAG: hypothetical protein LC723_06890, partial [Actinobacteria bacterium]|nr:hypothetical protein [Actinomycetota bacterium]
LGATKRLEEIQSEMGAILSAFPDLRKGAVKQPTTELPITPPTRKAYTMSPANRKAVAERMKKYWAAKRAGTKKKAAPAETSGHHYPKRKSRLLNKEGRVVATL